MNLNELTGPQRAMLMVLHKLYLWRGDDTTHLLKDGFEVELAYTKAKADDDGQFTDARNECRDTYIETTLTSPPVRNYDVKTVAQGIEEGVYVGWYYLYNGGPKSEPEAYDWVADAFKLDGSYEIITTRKYHFEVIA